MIIVLPVVFITMWYLFEQKEKNVIEGMVQAEIWFHFALLVITNIWSFGGMLNRWTVLASWCIVLAFIVLYGKVQKYFFAAKARQKQCLQDVKELTMIEKIMLCLMLVLFIVLLVGAIFTVPYNYDSMTYHLARIGHWIDQGSVNHYVTNIDRQIYSPVLSEYEMLHMMLLAGNDVFLNLLQYFAMIITGVILYQTAGKLGTSRAFSVLAAVLYYTMPLTISQSITTQNDLLASMWFAIFLYYLADFINFDKITFDREQKKKLILIGASVAFAFLTKTSICASMLFFMPWLVIVCIKRKDNLLKLISSAMLAGATLVVLISETLIRTYLSCGRLMADTTSANIMVATKNIKYIIVNICKNFSLLITQHLIRPLNGVIYRFAIRVGSILQVDFNHEAISYHGFDFLHHMNMGEDMYSHDKTSSAVVAYFALVAGIILVIALIIYFVKGIKRLLADKAKKAIQDTEMKPVKTAWYERINIGYAVSAWLSLGFIMALLRWQPWGTRLMYPALSVTVIMIANIAGAFANRKNTQTDINSSHKETVRGNVILSILTGLAILFCIQPVNYNMKPAIENIQAGCENRMSRYFRYNDRYTAYEQLIHKTEELGYTKIGLAISGDGYDYPLWLMYQKENKNVLLYHVILDEDDTKNIDTQTEYPECILYVEHGRIEVGEEVNYHGQAYECIYVSDINPDAPDAVLVKNGNYSESY